MAARRARLVRELLQIHCGRAPTAVYWSELIFSRARSFVTHTLERHTCKPNEQDQPASQLSCGSIFVHCCRASERARSKKSNGETSCERIEPELGRQSEPFAGLREFASLEFCPAGRLTSGLIEAHESRPAECGCGFQLGSKRASAALWPRSSFLDCRRRLFALAPS